MSSKLANKLKALREESGFTISELAYHLDTPPQVVTNAEKPTSNPHYKTLEKYEVYFKIPFGALRRMKHEY